MARTSTNARVEHHDDRFEDRRNQLGKTSELTVAELQDRAAKAGIKGRSKMRKDDLVKALDRAQRGNR